MQIPRAPRTYLAIVNDERPWRYNWERYLALLDIYYGGTLPSAWQHIEKRGGYDDVEGLLMNPRAAARLSEESMEAVLKTYSYSQILRNTFERVRVVRYLL